MCVCVCVSLSGPLTFKLVCVFVSDQSDTADFEFFEDDVDVTLHSVEWQVSYKRRERRL